MPKKSKKDKKKEIHLIKQSFLKILAGDIEALKLIPNLFEIKFTDYNWNILQVSIWENQKDVIKFCLSHTKISELVKQKDINDETALHLAAFTKNIELYNQLKETGAVENEKNKSGITPFQILSNNNDKPTHKPKEEQKITSDKALNSSFMNEGRYNSQIPIELTEIDRERINNLNNYPLHNHLFDFMEKHKKYIIN